VINLVSGVFLLGLSFVCMKDAWHVFRGRVATPRGKPLWVYAMWGNRYLLVKGRKQALVVTTAVAAISFLFGFPMVAEFVQQLIKS